MKIFPQEAAKAESRTSYLNEKLAVVFGRLKDSATLSESVARIVVRYSDDPIEHATVHLWLGKEERGDYVPTPIFNFEEPELGLSRGSTLTHRILRAQPFGTTIYRLLMRAGGHCGDWADDRASIVTQLSLLFEARLGELGYRVEKAPLDAPSWLRAKVSSARAG